MYFVAMGIGLGTVFWDNFFLTWFIFSVLSQIQLRRFVFTFRTFCFSLYSNHQITKAPNIGAFILSCS